jgi:uncharacterized protein (DUF4415 family)
MNEERIKKKYSNPVPPEIQAEIDILAALPEDKIDTEDLPEVRNWSGAKRGLFYRPIKQQITLRLDADLVDWFKNHHEQDEGYQTSINRALREYVGQHQS